MMVPHTILGKKNRLISKGDIIAFAKGDQTFLKQAIAKNDATVTTVEREMLPARIPPKSDMSNVAAEKLSDDMTVKREAGGLDAEMNNEQFLDQSSINYDPEEVLTLPREVENIIPSDETNEDEKTFIEFNFENADLQNFIRQIQDIFDITFLSDDAIDPLIKGARAVKGNKITFKTERPLSRNQAWELFVTFMQIAGLAVIKHNLPRTYRITTLESARKMAIPSFIGTYYENLPDSDEMIRYVYFIENSNLETIKNIVDSLRSTASSLVILQEQKAFILTERAYNIKKLMEIVKELDKASIPQSMSLLQLKQADAKTVKELYDSIIGTDDKNPANRFMNTRKAPTSTYFPENLKIIVEPRRNALILIGPEDATKKVEDFVKKYIDTELSQPYAAYFVYQLKYADANTVADIMNNVTQFGKDTDAGKFGGVRGNDQYMKQLVFVPEKETNRLIIKGKFEDYLHAVEVLEKLDAAPTQVEIEILILSVILQDTKSLGAQIRSKEGNSSLLGSNVKFQTSGLFQTSKIQENTGDVSGVNRLLGNLLQVVQGAASGNTIISLGSDLYNVWGVFQALQKVANTNTVANPFLTATNKTPAVVSLGQTRRVVTSTVVGSTTQDSFGEQKAELKVQITPQINSDGMIVLELDIQFDDFVNATNFSDATKNVRQIKTATVVANNEILALGGLVRAQSADNMYKNPIAGDLPFVGWLFKNKQKMQQKDNLLILISSHIIDPHETETVRSMTQKHVDEYYGTLGQMADAASAKKDPINKMFFEEGKNSLVVQAEDMLFGKKNSNVVIKRKRTSARYRKRIKANEMKSPIVDTPAAPDSILEHAVALKNNQDSGADMRAMAVAQQRKKQSPLKALLIDNELKEQA
ncbi:MAG TPA: hypothetical protein VL201_01965 [Patescibacteria group bacterium]|jgi:type II secretion system protein D|nr:hypothetical protein [Patescibacteria group bacterium]